MQTSSREEIALLDSQLRDAHAQAATLQTVAERLAAGADTFVAGQADVEALVAQASSAQASLEAAVQSERAARQAERDVLEIAEALRVQVDTAKSDLLFLTARLEESIATERSARASERDGLTRDVAERQTALDMATSSLAVSEGRLRELRAERELETELAERLGREAREAGDVAVAAEQRVSELIQERDRLQASADQAAAAYAEALKEERKAREALATRDSDRESRDTTIAAVNRDLVIEVERRMLDREIDGLRKAQATPDRLRLKMESFYSGHEALLARALFGPVRAHLAFAGKDLGMAEAWASTMASLHVERSRAEIQAVLDGDAAEFGVGLNAMLFRWEQSRVGRMADDLAQGRVTREVV